MNYFSLCIDRLSGTEVPECLISNSLLNSFILNQSYCNYNMVMQLNHVEKFQRVFKQFSLIITENDCAKVGVLSFLVNMIKVTASVSIAVS